MNYNNNSVEGFWGKPTSTVDWCEKNYDVTHYIAEFFNTFSSLCMTSGGIIGLIKHSKGFELRYTIAFAAMTMIGIGSILFHGTLLFSLQLFDEIPMMICVLILFYNMVENKSQKKFGIWFPILLTCWGVGISSIMIGYGKEYDNEFMQNMEFYVFQGSFLITSIIVYIRAILIVLDGDPSLTRLWLSGSAIFLFGYIGWHIDLNFCSTVYQLPYDLPNPQLHAWWHLTSAYGTYILIVVVCYERIKILGKKPTFKWFFNVLPFVHYTNKNDEKRLFRSKKELLYGDKIDEKVPLLKGEHQKKDKKKNGKKKER